jgi:predicted ABC-type exoprotein transport system permease subunit
MAQLISIFNPAALLKAVLSIFFALLLMLQFLSFPGQFRYMSEEEPENAHLRWPLTALSFLVILAVEIIVISVWKIVDALEKEKGRSIELKFVNYAIAALLFIWAVIAIGLVLLLLTADDPGLPVVITVIETAVTAVALLFLFYRRLLKRALNRASNH